MSLPQFSILFPITLLVSAQTTPPVSLSVEEKLGLHARRMVGLPAIAGSAASAAILQWRDEPDEWEQGGKGYGRRFASGLGFNAVRNLLSFGLDSTLKQDPRYFPLQTGGAWPRIRHALLQTVFTRTDSGGTSFSYWRFGSSYGAAAIATAWYPDDQRTAARVIGAGSVSIGFDASLNVLKEFWPEVKRKLRR